MDLLSRVALNVSSSIIQNIISKILDQTKLEEKEEITLWLSNLKGRNTAKAIGQVTHVKTLWSTDKEISLYEFYYPSKIETDKSLIKEISGLKDFDSQNNYVIEGTGGQGKSIFLRYLCGQELQSKYSSNRIPIFIELKNIQAGSSLAKLINDSLIKNNLKPDFDVFDILAQSGKLILLLDAFDEIDPSEITKCITDIENIADRYKDNLQIIITSRPNTDIQHSSKFRVCYLHPLDEMDHLPFLRKSCTVIKEAEKIYKAIQLSKVGVSNLLTTPLMMTLLILLYETSEIIPNTVPRFYEELFDVLFYRHDRTKPGFRRKRYTNLEDTEIKIYFSAFCFHAHLKNYGIFNTEQFNECCKLATKATGIAVDPILFRNEIIKTICLMLEEGFTYSFIHKSVLEFYFAEYVKSSSQEFAKKFYNGIIENYPSNRDWYAITKFLSQIDEYRYEKFYIMNLINEIENNFSINFSQDSDIDKFQTSIINEYFEKHEVRFLVNLVNKSLLKMWSPSVKSNNFIFEMAHNFWQKEIRKEINKCEIEFIKSIPDKYIIKTTVEYPKSIIEVQALYSEYKTYMPSTVINASKIKTFNFIKFMKFRAEEIINRENQNIELMDLFLKN